VERAMRINANQWKCPTASRAWSQTRDKGSTRKGSSATARWGVMRSESDLPLPGLEPNHALREDGRRPHGQQ
jgi:hypothetical protein